MLHLNHASLREALPQLLAKARASPQAQPGDDATMEELRSRPLQERALELLANQKVHIVYDMWDVDCDGEISTFFPVAYHQCFLFQSYTIIALFFSIS